MTPSELSRENKLWKDFIDRAAVEEIANTIGRISKKFDRSEFISFVATPAFFKLELKDRINSLADALRHSLPQEYKAAVEILIKAAPKLKGFGNWALTSYVERFGLEHFDLSMATLKELTKHGTAEFAVRPYVLADTNRALKVMSLWSKDKNEHVRRLAAEGTRPRGVWMPHIPSFKVNPKPVLEILEKLKADDSLYVRKAVANNLNDISKDNPKIALEVALRWKNDKNKHTDWIIKHGCRSLIKAGDLKVMEIFGFSSNLKLKPVLFKASKKRLKMGDDISFSCGIESSAKKSQKLAVDYRMHLAKANGKSSAKVFKWAEKKIAPGEKLELTIKHSFKKITTRKYYPGEHKVELLINGSPKAELLFKLVN